MPPSTTRYGTSFSCAAAGVATVSVSVSVKANHLPLPPGERVGVRGIRGRAARRPSHGEQPGTWVTLQTGDMVDSFPGLFVGRFTAGRPPRREAAKFFGLAIDDAELDIGKAD